MVFILGKSQEPASALARASYDRQVDVYRLAMMGNADSIRLWNDFAREAPGMARVVVADVSKDRALTAKANKSVDKRLRKAEKTVMNGRKPKAARSRPAVREIERVLDPRSAVAAAFINSDNPWEREAARSMMKEISV